MALEQDAEAFLRQLEYSLGDISLSFPNALQAIRLLIAKIHYTVLNSPSQPGVAIYAVNFAVGPVASSTLADLTGLCSSEPQAPKSNRLVQQFHALLGDICTKLGSNVQDLRDFFEFVFRDVSDLTRGAAGSRQNVELVLHLALGIEVAYQWHQICTATSASR
jgi:hypothetical protein